MEYGANNGLNRFIEAIGKFCLSGEPEIDGISIRQFFEDAISGQLSAPGKSKLRQAEEEEYQKFSDFLKSDIGHSLLRLMCEKNTAAEFFADMPQWADVLQEEFLDSEAGLPLRVPAIKKYTDRWYRERIADGTAAEYLKTNIKKRKNRRQDG